MSERKPTVFRARCHHCGAPATHVVYCDDCAEDRRTINEAQARIVARKRARAEQPELDS